MTLMETIKRHDTGPAVEDVQQRLVTIGLLDPADVDGAFGDTTAEAVQAFCGGAGLPLTDEVTEKVWAALVDASFTLGDRTLYLRMPHFHGHDVLELQHALGALGFACGATDGIFGAFTELALRKFQLNLGLPSDGIAGAYTYAAIRNLHHSWEGKEAVHGSSHLGFARAADVLERNASRDGYRRGRRRQSVAHRRRASRHYVGRRGRGSFRAAFRYYAARRLVHCAVVSSAP